MHYAFSKVETEEENQTSTEDEGTNTRFWDAMMNADRKDYERICTEFGVSDLHSILKRLEKRKKEREMTESLKAVFHMMKLLKGDGRKRWRESADE